MTKSTKDIIFSKNSNFILMSLKEDQIMTDVLKEHKLQKKSVLFKQGEKFFLRGFSVQGEWQITELDPSISQELKFNAEPQCYLSSDLSDRLLLEITDKKAHILPQCYIIWVGAPTELQSENKHKRNILQHDTAGIINLSQFLENPLFFICLECYHDYYDQYFKQYKNIQIISIESIIDYSQSEDPILKENSSLIQKIFTTYLKRGTKRDLVSLKNLISLLLICDGHYSLDSNIKALNQDSFLLPPFNDLRIPHIRGVTPEIWMMYAPKNNKKSRKALEFFLKNWNELEKKVVIYGINSSMCHASQSNLVFKAINSSGFSELDRIPEWNATSDEGDHSCFRLQELNLVKKYMNSHLDLLSSFYKLEKYLKEGNFTLIQEQDFTIADFIFVLRQALGEYQELIDPLQSDQLVGKDIASLMHCMLDDSIETSYKEILDDLDLTSFDYITMIRFCMTFKKKNLFKYLFKYPKNPDRCPILKNMLEGIMNKKINLDALEKIFTENTFESEKTAEKYLLTAIEFESLDYTQFFIKKVSDSALTPLLIEKAKHVNFCLDNTTRTVTYQNYYYYDEKDPGSFIKLVRKVDPFFASPSNSPTTSRSPSPTFKETPMSEIIEFTDDPLTKLDHFILNQTDKDNEETMLDSNVLATTEEKFVEEKNNSLKKHRNGIKEIRQENQAELTADPLNSRYRLCGNPYKKIPDKLNLSIDDLNKKNSISSS